MRTHKAVEILASFGVSARSVKKPPDAKLAAVYIVDDRYVLRSRPLQGDNESRFTAERNLLEAVAGFTGSRFPEYRTAMNGNPFVIRSGSFWTLHSLIPGVTLGNWYELHAAPPHADREVLTALRRLHDSTRGRFSEASLSRAFFPEMIRSLLGEGSGFLSTHAAQRVEASFLRVEAFSRTYPEEDACFVHGDFHHGNILAMDGKVAGFIDLDWCRAAHPLEDLAFTLMMLLRNYDAWSPAFQRRRYNELISLYGYTGDASILNDYIVLYALFDCDVFKKTSFENAENYYTYQTQFLEILCSALTRC